MHLGVSSLIMVLAVGQAPRESCCQTANFIVYAENANTAQRVAEAAEERRKQLAKLWLGKTMADWPAPCRIDVSSSDRVGGLTEISYSDGKVLFQKVSVRGPLERILTGPLPHELTHVLFAHHLGRQPPRWADEGGAIVSEGSAQRAAHRRTFAQIQGTDRQIALRSFLKMDSYPTDIPGFYAQSHSLAGFLVDAKGHQTFLAFLRAGLDGDWDQAANAQYGYASVEHLERAWIASLQKEANAGNRK
jgi:hypothetical protein